MNRQSIALLAAISISAIMASPAPAQTSPTSTLVTASAAAQTDPVKDRTKKKGTLYDRVGGIFAIAAVVDRFSDAIIVNPKLNRNPALVEWNQQESGTRLAGLKFMRTLWVASLAGGPFSYTGLPLPTAHKRFSLTEEEFNEVGAEIVRALEFYGVPEAEKNELVSAYMKSRPQVVSSTAAKTVTAPK